MPNEAWDFVERHYADGLFSLRAAHRGRLTRSIPHRIIGSISEVPMAPSLNNRGATQAGLSSMQATKVLFKFAVISLASIVSGCSDGTPLGRARSLVQARRDSALRLQQLVGEFDSLVAAWEAKKEHDQGESLPILRFADAVLSCLGEIKSVTNQLDELVKSPEGAYLSEADREFVRRASQDTPSEGISRSVGPDSVDWMYMEGQKRTAAYYLSKAEGIKEMRRLTPETLQRIGGEFVEELRTRQLVAAFLVFGSKNDESVLDTAVAVANRHCKRGPARYAVIDMLIRKPHGFIQAITLSDGYRDEVESLLRRAGVDTVRMAEGKK
jgi:hypothetical protein